MIRVRHIVCKASVGPKLLSGFTKLGTTCGGGGMAPGICIEPIVDFDSVSGDKSAIGYFEPMGGVLARLASYKDLLQLTGSAP